MNPVGVAFLNAILFYTYSGLKQLQHRHDANVPLSFAQLGMAGAGAGKKLIY
jgi:hypothetical protein